MQSGPAAGRTRNGAARRQRGPAAGSDRRPGGKTLRVQYHLGELTVERLGVHCSLTHRNPSAVVEDILATWLRCHGRGRELWPVVGPEEQPPTQEISAG